MISGATGAMAVVMVHMIQKGNEVGQSLDVPLSIWDYNGCLSHFCWLVLFNALPGY